MRAVVGMTIGPMNTAAISLLPELTEKPKTRDLLVSGFNAALSGIGMLVSFVAGFVAAIGWQWVFLLYLFSAPVLLLLAIFVPETPVPTPAAARQRAGKNILRPVVLLAISDVMMQTMYCMLYYQKGSYVEEIGLGGAELAGAMGSVGTLGTLAASLLLPLLYTRTGRGTPVVFFLLLAGSHLLLCIPANMINLIIYFFLAGFAYGLGLSYYFVRINYIVPPESVPLGISVITAANGTGMFLSTYVLTGLQRLIGTERIASAIPLVAIILLGMAGVSLVLTIRSKRKGAKQV